ncbi:MAG: gamma-glutamyltransferase [Bacteroidales bacterium]|jgi:gamma-glutamyltranspeptidase/glutathione hydrolase|nr:gamma-glutamyltransferase [Bacteroidales bacterium]
MKRILIIITAAGIISACNPKAASDNRQIIQGRSVTAEHGMVVSAHFQGSQTGVHILQKGGNAIDAAVATGFALAVCYPAAGNIGGGGFMLIRLVDGKYDLIDYREKAPLNATRDMYLDAEKKVINELSTKTHLAAGVPGAVDGLITLHERYGKLEFSEVIQPAIDLARNGFILTGEQAKSLNWNSATFKLRNPSGCAFVKKSGWNSGDTLKQPELAETLERIRDHGRYGFYSGKTADLIIDEMKRGNGIISYEDLNQYHSVFRKPLTKAYRNFYVITCPPPSAGGIILFQLLGIVENYPLNLLGFHSPKMIHLIAEAERRAFADRAEYAGDIDFVKVPVTGLIDSEYLKLRFADFNDARASVSAETEAGSAWSYENHETTHYSVIDKDGNAVAVTTTLNGSYGSGIVVADAGFFLNNEMDDFSVKPGFPNMFGLTGSDANSIAPGKRMLSSMTPVIVEKEGKLFLIAGSPGGSTIPTSVFQVIINVTDYNMNIWQAVDTGRFHHQWLPDSISFERNSIDSVTLGMLKRMGHITYPVGALGSVNAICVLQDGRLAGAGDKRGDNSACGY